jgi:trk system potassium uptake protein TrkA
MRLARTLTHENVLDHVPLAEDYSIIEISPPEAFLHKSLGELDLRRKYGIQVIVVKGIIPKNVVLVPTADYVIKDSDILVIMGKDEDLRKIQKP